MFVKDFNIKTLDTLDKTVYTLDILDSNIGHITYGGDHGNSIGSGSESRSAGNASGVFSGQPSINVQPMRRTHGE